MKDDPIEALLASARAASDQTVAFYSEHLDKVVTAYRRHMARHDRDGLLNNMVKALMEDPTNTREALCYQVVVSIDRLARQQ